MGEPAAVTGRCHRKSIGDFLQAVEALPLEAAANEHARAWQRLLRQFVRPTDADEGMALRKLHEQLNALQGWTTLINLEEFVALLEKGCVLPINERRDALRVASVSQARGMWASVVILELKRPEEVTYALDARTVGKIWHSIMEGFLRLWIEKGEMPDEKALQDIAGQIIGELTCNYPEQVRALLSEQALTALPRIWKAEQNEARQWTPLMVEKELSLPAVALGCLPETLHKFHLKMKPDRVDNDAKGNLRITDYKTGGVPGQTDIKNGVALQLPLYALAVGREKAKPVIAAHFIKLLSFTQSGYSTGCVLSAQPKGRQMPLTEAIQHTTGWARQFLWGIAAADFTVRPFDFGQSCRNCDFKALCRRHPLRIAERGKAAEISDD